MIETTFAKIIEWVWVPIVGALVMGWLKLSARIRVVEDKQSDHRSDADKRLSLVEHHLISIEQKLTDFDTRRHEDRQEIMARIDKHAEAMYKKLDKIADR